ncbi:dihydrofolate reductase [Mangrovimicrobium sediminis]|uniref:Dihydrofolate reductase n=1 Tax=Mangrovimicrobium sediminis TaxID=2562682 RepID=A0A4Z0M8G4_9GAMM|nr:dihydrofolate reductase [Haliea sp. SAOS-164]TGD75764.1 dihydrofolate reductase [Haliea sp. SAOS-164]
MPRLAVIVAAATNDVIGRDGGLPWHLPADLKHFRDITMGKPMLMGRKTYDSIGRPLPGRTSIVVTRDTAWSAPAGVHVVYSEEQGQALAAELAREQGLEEYMLIGGAQLYASLLPQAQRIYLTRVQVEVRGDARFPALDAGEWREVSREDHAADDKNPTGYSFIVLDRVVTVI